MDGNSKFKPIDLAIMAMLTAIIFIQEQLFTIVPNVQLTVFLLVLYSKKIGFIRTSIILAIHVVLDNLVIGSFSYLYTPFMFIGWMFIPIIFCTFMKRVENPLILGIVSVLCSFFYCWVYIIPNVIFYNINLIAYLISDIMFECVLATCSFLTVLILYKPCSKVFDSFNISKSRT